MGNLNLGGAGKTPTAIAIAQHLQDTYPDLCFLSRGYGGQEAGPLQVQPTLHKAKDVGDEPLLLSAFAPTWVARDRAEGAQAAVGAGAACIILDDGCQRPAIR